MIAIAENFVRVRALHLADLQPRINRLDRWLLERGWKRAVGNYYMPRFFIHAGHFGIGYAAVGLGYLLLWSIMGLAMLLSVYNAVPVLAWTVGEAIAGAAGVIYVVLAEIFLDRSFPSRDSIEDIQQHLASAAFCINVIWGPGAAVAWTLANVLFYVLYLPHTR